MQHPGRSSFARFVGLLVLCIFTVFGTSCKPRSWSDSQSPIPVTSKDPMWGDRSAPVTLVLYSDFQCPFCGRLVPTLEQIKSTYQPKDLRIIWKNEPLSFHNRAKPAAEAAAGVMELKGSAAFWKFHDYAFKNQQALTDENFALWAKDVGVRDIARFKTNLASHKWASKVDVDHDEAKAAGVMGTPCAFINGVKLNGAQPFEKWKTVIDEELTKAENERRAGTPRDRIYVTMSTRNKRAEPPPSVGANTDTYKAPDTTTVHDVPVGTSPVLGNPKAPVTLVVFSDFQCPFCKRIESTFEELRKTYGTSIRFVWKNNPLPFHKNAVPAANFAMEARSQKGDQTFWAAHDLLFGEQQNLSEQTLEGFAKQLGLDVQKTMAAVRTEKWKSVIDADKALADKLEARGTPATFVNGRFLTGAQPLERFKTIIDEELQKAKSGGLGVQGGAVQPKVNLAP